MKIVIVGGGTAAWIAASYLAKEKNPDYKITIVESLNIPIIGAGEGVTGLFTYFLLDELKGIGSNLSDFLIETDATFKFGIKFKNFKGYNDEYYHPIDISPTSKHINDIFYLFNLEKNKPHLSSFSGHAMEQKKSPYYTSRDEIIPNDDIQSFAFNFDGVKVGQYLKKISLGYCNHINGDVTNVNFNENGHVKSITLNDGKEVEGDIFIDCTGFARIFSNKMDNTWVSYKDTLPVNTSILYQKKYTDDYEINAETVSTAMKYGWSFQVPTQKRIGCGYVFSDDFVTEEKALEEFSQVMGEDIQPLKTIKFETGKLDKIFNKNVLSLGLSGSFVEPAQATAIHVTLSQIRTFVSIFLRDTVEKTLDEFNVKTYNKIIDGILNEHKSLIEVNYITGRRNTEFWRYLQDDAPRNEYVQEILDICKYRIPSTIEFEDKFGYAGWGVWCWILAGNNIITPEMATKEIKRLNLRRFESEYLNHLDGTKKYVSGLMNNNDFVRNMLMNK